MVLKHNLLHTFDALQVKGFTKKRGQKKVNPIEKVK